MIQFSKVKRGDILRVVAAGAPGYCKHGDLVRVKEAKKNSVPVEDGDGEECRFWYNCGRARLQPTEWTNDFPAETAA